MKFIAEELIPGSVLYHHHVGQYSKSTGLVWSPLVTFLEVKQRKLGLMAGWLFFVDVRTVRLNLERWEHVVKA